MERLLEDIVDAYFRARNPIQQHQKLSRGEARSVASEVEDLVAAALIRSFPSIEHIYINQTLNIVGEPKLQIKPDLTLLCGNELRAFLDVKMDLGRKREEIITTLELAHERIKALRGREVTLRRRLPEGTRSNEKVAVAKGAKYIFIVVSDQNISAEQFKKVEAAVSRLPSVSLFTAVRGFHPNKPGVSKEVALAQSIEKGCPLTGAAFRDFELLLGNTDD